MTIEIVHEPVDALASYATVPSAFLVGRVADVTTLRDGPSRAELHERRIATPYIKDYDAADGGGPLRWPARFDVSRWVLLGAYVDRRRVGGAAVAFDTPELSAGRDDLAVLWDLRVAPAARGRGVGSGLFRAVEAQARLRGCRELMAETQNVNVAACRFYARQGCVLRAANRLAYADLPDEVQLLWYKLL